jgi:hypothetical protein
MDWDAQPVENSRADLQFTAHMLRDRALFRFQEQKLPANGHSHAHKWH